MSVWMGKQQGRTVVASQRAGAKQQAGKLAKMRGRAEAPGRVFWKKLRAGRDGSG